MHYAIHILENGPYQVTGGVPLYGVRIVPKGRGYTYERYKEYPLQQQYMLCRCGETNNAPFCDGAHVRAAFHGAEKASRMPYAQRAERLHGQTLDLLDDGRCAFARFCHSERGDVWTLARHSNDLQNRALAIKTASDCPAGRLTAVDKKTGELIEPELEPCIEVLDDPEKGVGACLFVKGGIPLFGADGAQYELRNRYALCRCGQSENKPFCDAMHVPTDYHP